MPLSFKSLDKASELNVLSRHSVCRSVSYVQSARSSDRFHGEREAQAAAAPPPWTGSLCERPGSPRCWRIRPEEERGNGENQYFGMCFFLWSGLL